MGINVDAWFNLGLLLIIFSVLVVYCLYYIGYYAHPGETEFGRLAISRLVIAFGIILAYLQILTVQFDVFASDSLAINTNFFWYILQLSQLVYVFIICPVGILIYESDDTLPACRRVGKAIKI
jgi:magnesium-transporting ATPase (P-type)